MTNKTFVSASRHHVIFTVKVSCCEGLKHGVPSRSMPCSSIERSSVQKLCGMRRLLRQPCLYRKAPVVPRVLGPYSPGQLTTRQ